MKNSKNKFKVIHDVIESDFADLGPKTIKRFDSRDKAVEFAKNYITDRFECGGGEDMGLTLDLKNLEIYDEYDNLLELCAVKEI